MKGLLLNPENYCLNGFQPVTNERPPKGDLSQHSSYENKSKLKTISKTKLIKDPDKA